MGDESGVRGLFPPRRNALEFKQLLIQPKISVQHKTMTASETVATLPIAEILRLRFGIEPAAMVAIAERFKIAELGLFGSALREDFRAEGANPSDVDLLVTFQAGSRLSWQDWLQLEAEMESLFGRKVDLCQKQRLQNPYSRHEILRTYRLIYER
jgi:uncharacterized protein